MKNEHILHHKSKKCYIFIREERSAGKVNILRLWKNLILTGMLLISCYALAEADFGIQVRNGIYERNNLIVSYTITHEWAAQALTYSLFETEGSIFRPVPFGIDNSGKAPVLHWLMTSRTEPHAVRRFIWRPHQKSETFTSDLQVKTTNNIITISNTFFQLKHPVAGGGGFPYDITYAHSDNRDTELYFLDRLVHRPENDGPLKQYAAHNCKKAEARVVHSDPLRVIIETITSFKGQMGTAPGNPRAKYRYTYSAYSPVIEVSATLTREDETPWHEVHFLHLTRKNQGYSDFVVGDRIQTHTLQKKGKPSRGLSGWHWAVMQNSVDACGVGFRNAFCWDASSSFVYYVRSGLKPWNSSADLHFNGGLYLGPSGKPEWYAQWLGRQRSAEIHFYKNGKPWVPLERPVRSDAVVLENNALRLSFDTPENGFDCLGIDNKLSNNAPFVRMCNNIPGLWSLTFKTQRDPVSGKRKTAELNNHSPVQNCFSETVPNGVNLIWKGMNLPGSPGAVDVQVQIRMKKATGASEWRIQVDNRDTKFGIWETGFPLLRQVIPPGQGDVLLPRGNFGGLHPLNRSKYEGTYPSARCALQTMAFHLGDAGLYIAAHDSESCIKRFTLTKDQDFMLHLPAKDAGQPGSAEAPEFPVVIAAYKGNWWQAARLYREWATNQRWTAKGPIRERKDYPRRLTEMGLWMRTNVKPSEITKLMNQATLLYPDIPIGVHWYNWHQIPFDHSYPEYFPAKEGMQEAVHSMTEKGQMVMPYINGRLWDRDIPSFEAVYTAACKNAEGTNIVEVYNSKRNMVPMCPATTLWQKKMCKICSTLINKYGVNAIYLDQIGAARPCPCFDPTHSHPLGGGSYWADGYRTMLEPIKAEATRKGVALTTENTAEPYIDTIDAYLSWSPHYQSDVPLLPAIYSDYTTYFSSAQSPEDSIDAFCAAQARDFLWGCQLGWNGSWILKKEHREKQRFQHKLCHYRLAAKDFLVYGQLIGEAHPVKQQPEISHIWHRKQRRTVRLPAVMGTLWLDDKERLGFIVVNTTNKPQTFHSHLTPEQWLSKHDSWNSTLLTPEGERPVMLNLNKNIISLTLQPREIRVIVFTGK